MAGDSESYLSLLEDNHWVMIKSVDPEVFLDYMRQHHVLSEEDCQTIQNYFVHHTRRARMRKSCHVLYFCFCILLICCRKIGHFPWLMC